MFAVNSLEVMGILAPINPMFYPHYIPEMVGLFFFGVTCYSWKFPAWAAWLMYCGIILFFFLPTMKLILLIVVGLLLSAYLVGYYTASWVLGNVQLAAQAPGD